MTEASKASFADLDEAQFGEILRLQRFYHRESQKCEAAKAYLSGCVMLGAALEAGLLAMAHCFAEEVASCKGVPRAKRHGVVKPLLKWKLSELLRVAKTLGWLPASLELDQEWNHQTADIGDHAE